jgi:ABC-type branched-subunit amino acid transport system ATPase component
VSDFSVRYQTVAAVDSISLEVGQGRLVGLIGPNGAGKTSLVDGLSGLTPASGTALFDGKPIEKLSSHRRVRHGLVRTFQSLELFEELTVRENLLVAADQVRWWSAAVDLLWARSQRRTEVQVDETLEMLGLTDYASALPRELSLGQRKLVTVARGLARRPKLLLLDEPAAGLDSGESTQLGAQLRDIVAAGTSVLLVDHDMGLVLGFCEDIYVLEFGKIIAHGTPPEIRSDERVIHAYLGGGAVGSETASKGAIK